MKAHWIKIAGAMVVGLGSITLQQEFMVRSSADWHWLTRNPIRKDMQAQLRACLDRHASPADQRYRTLYTGIDENWGSGAETELQGMRGEKALFAYREMDHPFTGILRSTFTPGTSRPLYLSNLRPPPSTHTSHNVPWIKLMGVRDIVSGGSPIDSPEVELKGTCEIRYEAKRYFPGLETWYEAHSDGSKPLRGTLYVYRLKEPLGLYFSAERVRMHSLTDSLKVLFEKTAQPWLENTIYLEPPERYASNANLGGLPAITVQSVSETSHSVRLQILVERDAYLVAGYAYRPGWSGHVDGKSSPLLRAYGGFLSLALPKGKHLVELKYSDRSIPIGFLLSFLALPLAWFSRKLVGFKSNG